MLFKPRKTAEKPGKCESTKLVGCRGYLVAKHTAENAIPLDDDEDGFSKFNK